MVGYRGGGVKGWLGQVGGRGLGVVGLRVVGVPGWWGLRE